jgi:hypothetical protein
MRDNQKAELLLEGYSRLVAEGRKRAEIAQALGIDVRKVDYLKTKAKNRRTGDDGAGQAGLAHEGARTQPLGLPAREGGSFDATANQAAPDPHESEPDPLEKAQASTNPRAAAREGKENPPGIFRPKNFAILIVSGVLFWFSGGLIKEVFLHPPAKLEIDQNLTRKLYDSMAAKVIGGPNQEPRLTDKGILLAAGGKPNGYTFSIGGKFRKVNLRAQLIKLPPNADPKAGMAGVEVFVDGVSKGRHVIHRKAGHIWPLNLSRAGELVLILDKSNGTNLWDWVEFSL